MGEFVGLEFRSWRWGICLMASIFNNGRGKHLQRMGKEWGSVRRKKSEISAVKIGRID